jgi:hypothetical protein
MVGEPLPYDSGGDFLKTPPTMWCLGTPPTLECGGMALSCGGGGWKETGCQDDNNDGNTSGEATPPQRRPRARRLETATDKKIIKSYLTRYLAT